MYSEIKKLPLYWISTIAPSLKISITLYINVADFNAEQKNLKSPKYNIFSNVAA